MVGRHEVHGMRTQQPRTLQLASIAHEAQKTRVIHGGGQQAASTAVHGHGTARVQHTQRYAAVRVMRKRFGNAVLIGGIHRKAGLKHAQRGKNMLLQVVAE